MKPLRHGVAYLALRSDGAILVETRPEKGLLGGMLGLPGTPWGPVPPAPDPPAPAAWRDAGAEVRHTFTHFHLRLRVEVARVEKRPAASGDWRPWSPALEAAMPTVMRKAMRLGRTALET